MRQADFAGARQRAAANQSGVGNRVMGRAKGAGGDHRVAIQQTHHAVHLGSLNRFFEGHFGQDGGQALGEHRLARSRRPDHQHVMAAGCGHLQRAFGLLLAAHLAEIQVVGVGRREHLADIGLDRR